MIETSALAHDRLAPAITSLVEAVRHETARVVTNGADDSEAIHDLRVALRRLRTMLRAARRVYKKSRVRAAAEELRRFANTAGAVRDDEVLGEVLRGLRLGAPARAAANAWLRRRSRQERARRTAVVKLLSETGRGSLAEALDDTVRALVPRKDRTATAVALSAMKSIAREIEALGADAWDSGAGALVMHELRIRYKRQRYTAELFAVELGDASAGVAKAATKMQKRLGDLHDVDMALARVRLARGLPVAAKRALLAALARRRTDLAIQARASIAVAMRSDFEPPP